MQILLIKKKREVFRYLFLVFGLDALGSLKRVLDPQKKMVVSSYVGARKGSWVPWRVSLLSF